jgi:DNA-binding NtrC family response regulator
VKTSTTGSAYFPIVMPSLQDRMEDFPSLVSHILLSMKVKPMEISGKVIEFLKEYDWPGNIRELKNMIERALILSHGEPPEIRHFPGLSDERISIYQSWKIPKILNRAKSGRYWQCLPDSRGIPRKQARCSAYPGHRFTGKWTITKSRNRKAGE